MYITVNNTNYYVVDIRTSCNDLDVMLTTDASLVSIYQSLWENEFVMAYPHPRRLTSIVNMTNKFPVYVVSCQKFSDLKSIISKLSENHNWKEHGWYDGTDV